MKKIFILSVLLALASACYLAVGPFIAIHQIKAAVEKQDPALLAENIDFPVLRANVKEQVRAFFATREASGSKHDPLKSLVLGIGSRLADSAVDAIVTPGGLAGLMEGRQPGQTQAGEAKPLTTKRQLLRDARYSLDDAHTFSALIEDDKGRAIRFVLTRYGLTWKLTNVIIPLADQSRNEVPRSGGAGD